MLSPVPGLGDGRGGALAVPALVPAAPAAVPVARAAERRTTTVVLPPAVVTAEVPPLEDRFGLGTLVDTFA